MGRAILDLAKQTAGGARRNQNPGVDVVMLFVVSHQLFQGRKKIGRTGNIDRVARLGTGQGAQ